MSVQRRAEDPIVEPREKKGVAFGEVATLEVAPMKPEAEGSKLGLPMGHVQTGSTCAGGDTVLATPGVDEPWSPVDCTTDSTTGRFGKIVARKVSKDLPEAAADAGKMLSVMEEERDAKAAAEDEMGPPPGLAEPGDEDDDDDESPQALPDAASLPEGVPSVGSFKHGNGDCRPCAWFHKTSGCANGKDCRHCHLCPEGEIKSRKKTKADALRAPVQPCNKVTAMRSTMSERPGGSTTKSSNSHSSGRGDDTSKSVRPPPGLGFLPMTKSRTEPAKSTIQLAPGAMSGFVSGPQESLGSAEHSTKQCRPCAWYWKPPGCENGKDCRHCHLCDEGEIRARKKVKATTLRVEKTHSDVDDLAPMMGHMPSLSAPYYQTQQQMMMSMISPAMQQMDGPPPSVGSMLHPLNCRPCAWFHKKPKGCENGAECRHCHLCPEGEIQARRKMKLSMLRQQKGMEFGEAQDYGEGDMSPTHHEMMQLAQMEKQFLAQWEANVAAVAQWDWDMWQEAFAEEMPMSSPFACLSDIEASPYGLDTIGEMSPVTVEYPEELLLKFAADAARAEVMTEAATATPSAEGDERTPRTPAILSLDESLSMGTLGATSGSMADNGTSSLDPATVTGVLTVTDAEVTPGGATSSSTLPSMGSALHSAGRCRPCAWFHKPNGCQNGQACAHCHLCPEGELKNRKRAKENAMRAGAVAPARSLNNARSPRVVRIAPILTS